MIKRILSLSLFLLVGFSSIAQTPPVAVDDNLQGTANAVTNIDVLNIGVDSDADADEIGPESVGTDYINNLTFAGGTVVVNDNGTPNFINDDYVKYTPPTGWTGLDSTYYVLIDTTGQRDTATIRIFIWNDDDLDGLFGTLDLDSDNDGILDIDEDGGTGFDPSDDADADGIPNYADYNDATPGFPVFADVNNDGINDIYDNDSDGVPDFTDVDSDNDGIPDAFEANQGVAPSGYQSTFGRIVGFDSDNDGLVDPVDNAPSVAYGPGSTSTQVLPDTDNDGFKDYYDLDSDNDGIADIAEAGGDDTNGDGIIDGFQDSNGDGVYDAINLNQLPIPNTDGTGRVDYLDVDSDDDGIDDTSEGYTTAAYPGNALGTDSDSDGIDDAFDSNCTGGGSTFFTIDYAEENTSNGNVNLTSSDIELTYDGVQQEVGLVFGNIAIPQGATITSAYIQFQTDEVSTGGLAINIFGEDTPNAAVYTGSNSEVSNRTKTALSVSWSPNGWNTVGQAGADQQSDDITAIVQSLVNNASWTSGNNMGFILTGAGTNRRTAETNPTLVIAYTGGGGTGCASITPLVDTDGDGTPDLRDLDSDGDGESDAIEGHDTDFDGVANTVPSGNDNDNDGIDDAFDTDAGTFYGTSQSAALPNEDLDGEPDWRDLFDIQNPAIFYYTCDASDELYSFNIFTGVSTFIGSYNAQATNIEGIAYWNGTLYAADAGVFGTLSLTTGAFTTIGQIDGGGSANGSLGAQSLNDVDGLSFDPWTGILWGSNRRTAGYDILFQIDPTTGLFIPDAFGTGVDYVVIDGQSIYQLIDDIAISPTNGKMYTVGNDGTNDQLLEINKYTGTVALVVGTMPQSDIEGMSYFNAGEFYGTVGSSPGVFWEIDPATADMTGDVTLPCGDPEAVVALTAPANVVSGTVWGDDDFSQTINGTESGVAGVDVNLYYDVNGDGQLDPGDILLQTETTDVNGDYTFLFATTANLIATVDLSTLPNGYALTTDNIETVVFTDNVNFNETDAANNFGIATDSDCDGDGIPDFAEGGVGVDFDGDGVDNMCDLDSDNDGILDAIEFTADTDGDGLPNYTDIDSDNDGIPDAIEANSGIAPAGYNPNQGFISGVDTDGDGLLDVVDNAPAIPYGGTSSSTLLNPDHDIDGVYDYLDKDSDNDGIFDVIEAGGTDSNYDGVIDGFNDGNNDGLSDGLNTNPLPIPNTDLDGNPDYIDFDSDGDGIDDTREGLSTANYSTPGLISDADGDGIIDYWDTNLGGNAIVLSDVDGDGIPDYQDLDSDNDGVPDVVEGNDANMDGIQDYFATNSDVDGDGIDDAFDQNCSTGVPTFGTADYAEENTSNGNVNLTSSDLELTFGDGNQQEVGIVFGNITIPQGTTITSAYIQFQTDEVTTGNVTINIFAEDVVNAAVFTGSNSEVSNKTKTASSVTWNPNDWNIVGESGSAQQTPSLTTLVQSIVNKATWTSGNNMAFILTGSGSNTRTAENNPTLIINYTGGGLSWGCTTNTPLQDTDTDGEHDFRDFDDDGDGIASADELADIDGSGSPDYLEISACPPGQTLATVNGNADVVISSNNVTNPTNALNAPDGNEVTYANNNNSRVVVDLTDMVPAGTNVVMTWRKISGGGNATLRVDYSATGTGGWTTIADYSTSSTTLITTNVLLPVTTRYLRIRRRARVPGLDGLTYSITQCSPDQDMDGIPDLIDLDDDNDGISDLVEGNLDTDGDGIINSLDLDSDNDGIPDAIEANAGVLPTGMNTEGMYPPNVLIANDANTNGWFETAETGATYSNNTVTPLDTDNDGFVDYLDLDSDNDCITDAVEANYGVLPSDMDDNGQYPAAFALANDTDGDGLIDPIDPDNGGTSLDVPDTDGDGFANYIDLDSDEDGIVDALEAFDPDITMANSDADNDGIDDGCDPDAGGTIANMPDEDCNGIFDYLDINEATFQSGAYNIAGTWDDGSVPVSGSSIRVASGHTLTLIGNTIVAGVVVDAGGILDISGYELTVLGSFTINGDFTHNFGKVIFEGSCPQTICGDINFYDIEINNGNGVAMNCGDITIDHELELTDGGLNTCDANSVTLTSSAGQNAYIAGSGTGTISCDVIRERHKVGCQDGFMLLATPYTSNTYNNTWGDDFLITGVPGGPFPTFWTSIYLYDETQPGTNTDGFVGPSSANSLIPRGRGHYVYIGTYQLPNTIDMTGTPDLSPYNFDLQYTAYGNNLEDGWNLLGNPYPSPIDWDDPSGWNNVGCCNSVWTWNECNSQFSSYIAGVGTNDGTNVVESCQAFWVKAHIPGSSLSINREAMTDDNGDFKSLGNPIDAAVTLHMNGFSEEDEAVVRLKTGSSHACDNVGDAFNKISSETLMGLYTLTSDNVGMSINAFPNDSISKTIPVLIRVPQDGSYTIDFDGINSFPNDVCLLFEDLETGAIVDMKASMFYTFNHLSLANFEHRFNVTISYPISTEVFTDQCASVPAYAVFQPNGVGPYNVTWSDDLGNTVQTSNGISTSDTLMNVNAGLYTIDVIDLGAVNCSYTTDTVIIPVTTPLAQTSGIVTHTSCNGSANDGAINLNIAYGTQPFTYQWSNGSQTQDIAGLTPGNYQVTVTDAYGCESQEMFTINNGSNLTAGIQGQDTLNLAWQNPTLTFNSNSIGANALVWYPENDTLQLGQFATITYTTVGEFDIKLAASNGPCSDTAVHKLVVIDDPNAINPQDGLDINAWYNGSELAIELDREIKTVIQMNLFDNAGKLVLKESIGTGRSGIQLYNIDHLSKGIYTLRLYDGTLAKTIRLSIQ